jgi:hypothetical protein
MAKRHEVFPSRFLAAADLNGKPVTLTIESAPIETLKNKGGEDTKTVLYFRGTKKCLPLNRTNWDNCADICGDDSDDWGGHRVTLYPTTTQFGSDVVDCIRIKEPEQAELPMKEKKKPVPAKPEAAQPLAEEMADEIPF